MSSARLKLVLSIAVSLFALHLLLTGIDRAALVRAWSHISPGGVLLALALLAAGYTLRVVRWWWMLVAFAPRLRLRDCATPFLASLALNNVLPLRAGDAVRAFGFRGQLGLSAPTVLGTVLLERLLDLAMLLAVFFAGAAAIPEHVLPAGMAQGARLVAAAAVAVLVLLPLLGPLLARRLAASAGGGPAWLRAAPRAAADVLASFSLLRSARRAALLLPLTVLIWLLEGAVFVTVAADLTTGTRPLAGWFAMATGTLATLLPSTPGYVGTFDYFAMLGLSAFGAERSLATAFSLSVHAILWAPVTAVGLALLGLHGGMSAFRTRPKNGALT